MRIWIIDHYSVPPKYYPLARNTNFAKQFQALGHEVKIFAASSVHNSDMNLCDSQERYMEIIENDVHYVLIRCCSYTGNGIGRIFNMYEFAHKLSNVCKYFERPDVIISQSMTLQACMAGVKIAKQYGCKSIAQITDLWPETVVAYGVASKYNPAVIYLRSIEKWIYKNADAIVFSMEGAYEYICEQKWEREVPNDKVYFINNGVDIDLFDLQKDKYIISNRDIANCDKFNVVYTGSIRRVNNVNFLLDVAKEIKNKDVVIHIWGAGDDVNRIQERIKKENIKNVIYEGVVEKRFIPYILSKADLLLMHVTDSPLLRFGISPNKLFDYMAAGKPILSDFNTKYNPAITLNCGKDINKITVKGVAAAIEEFVTMSVDEYNKYCKNSRIAAKQYDFKVLAKKFLEVIEKA